MLVDSMEVERLVVDEKLRASYIDSADADWESVDILIRQPPSGCHQMDLDVHTFKFQENFLQCNATTCSASPLTFVLLLHLHKQAGHSREASYLQRIQIAWILMHEVRPPQLDIGDSEHSRWLAGGGHGAAVPVYQRDLQGGRGRTLDSDFISH